MLVSEFSFDIVGGGGKGKGREKDILSLQAVRNQYKSPNIH